MFKFFLKFLMSTLQISPSKNRRLDDVRLSGKVSPDHNHFSGMHLWLKENGKCNGSYGPVIGTITSISISLANFGMELTHNSNSSLDIGAATPTSVH